MKNLLKDRSSFPTRQRGRNEGLTLIELTVAIALVAVLFSAVVIGIGALTGTKAKAATTEIAGTIRSLYDTASLTGKTCRLVFDLQNEKQATKYWAECAAGNVAADLAADQSAKKRNRAESLRKKKPTQKPTTDLGSAFSTQTESTFEEVMSREKERVEAATRFSIFTSPQIESRQLPPSVQVSIWTKHQRDVVKNGLAYLYFFPQGFTERAQVWVRQGRNVWTVTLAPLTGKTVIVGDELEVPRT